MFLEKTINNNNERLTKNIWHLANSSKNEDFRNK